MSEKVNPTEGNIKPITKEELETALSEIKALREENEKQKIDLHAAKAREAKYITERKTSKTRSAGNESEAKPVTSDTESTPHLHEDAEPREIHTGHLLHPWQHFCTGVNCEGENPNFKDETQCETCGMHLGAVEVAEKLSRCPSCGGKQVKRIK